MTFVFLLRHFNDIDHISPVIWSCLERGDDVTVVLLDRTYDTKSDPRLQFLSGYQGFEMVYGDEVFGLPKGMFRLAEPDGRVPERVTYRRLRWLFQRTDIYARWITPKLAELDPDVCVFEWGPPDRMSHAEFFQAATRLDVPTVCLPHGLNIYLNRDITPYRKSAVENNDQIMASRNGYDAYVSQSQYHRDQDIKFGVNPDVYHVLGSTRYYPEWQAVNESFYDRFEVEGNSENRVRTVFMLPHWEYHVDKEQTLAVIRTLANEDWVYLVVKEHTRGDSLPDSLEAKLSALPNADLTASAPSVSLIKWADSVINFGSSIGIEALLQDKHHVNPHYLHTNTTIFDQTEAAHQIDSESALVALMNRIHNETADDISEKNKRTLFRRVIYAGEKPFDVLEAYRNLLIDVQSN